MFVINLIIITSTKLSSFTHKAISSHLLVFKSSPAFIKALIIIFFFLLKVAIIFFLLISKLKVFICLLITIIPFPFRP